MQMDVYAEFDATASELSDAVVSVKQRRTGLHHNDLVTDYMDGWSPSQTLYCLITKLSQLLND